MANGGTAFFTLATFPSIISSIRSAKSGHGFLNIAGSILISIGWRSNVAKKNDKFTYRVTWSEDDAEYVGLCAEFPSLSWLAQTPEAALKGIRKLVDGVISDMLSNEESVPEPIATKHFSGKFMVRVPPDVHRELAIQAAEAGVSLNRLASAKLSH